MAFFSLQVIMVIFPEEGDDEYENDGFIVDNVDEEEEEEENRDEERHRKMKKMRRL